MNFISMASGIEAASVAFGPLGWTPVAFSEIEKFPSSVLAHHYPDVPNVGDLAAFDWSVYRDKVDAVCAGFPCQAFSIAGLGKSLEDDRGNLSIVGVKAIRLIRPRWVLLEQVPGVLSKPDNPFGCILAGLCGADAPLLPGTKNGKWSGSGIVLPASKDGYGLAWRILDAQYFGVPQRRRRVFVVGYLGDWKPAAEVLFEPEGLRRDTAAGGEAGKGTAAKVEGRAGGEVECYRWQNDKDGIVKDNIMASLKAKGRTTDERSVGAYVVQSDFCPIVLNDQGGSVMSVSENSGTLRANTHGNEQIVAHTPLALKIRQGCEGGGKGDLGSEDKAFTISTTEDQHIFAPSCFRAL